MGKSDVERKQNYRTGKGRSHGHPGPWVGCRLLMEYIEDHDISFGDLAARAGWPSSRLSKYFRGICKPESDSQHMLELVTDGFVPMKSWLKFAEN